MSCIASFPNYWYADRVASSQPHLWGKYFTTLFTNIKKAVMLCSWGHTFLKNLNTCTREMSQMYSSGSKKLPLSLAVDVKSQSCSTMCPSPPQLFSLCSRSKLDPLLRSNEDTFLWINLKAEMHERSENFSAPELVLENAACNFHWCKLLV